MPSWIERAHSTILSHSLRPRPLDPRSFDKLWDRDRRLDIRRLYVAHRADVIRAFLLYRYGGLWVDADCIVLKNLDEIVTRLTGVDFATYRNADGVATNNFMYAPPGSPAAATYYGLVRKRLLSDRPRRWTSLGAEPLGRAINRASPKVHFFPTDLIQPVHWADPGRFFQVASEEQHATRFNPNAVCYMLSNQTVMKYRRDHPGALLEAPGSFFEYVLSRAQGVRCDRSQMQ